MVNFGARPSFFNALPVDDPEQVRNHRVSRSEFHSRDITVFPERGVEVLEQRVVLSLDEAVNQGRLRPASWR